jgi:pyridoxine kinase
MNVLSIQSSVSFGHVGNSAAVFVLERLGHEVMPLNTVTLAHHPGYGQWRGRVAEAQEMAALIAGLEEVGAIGRCDAVLSGYLGDAALGTPLLDAVARVKRANREALYLCDPVMGDSAKGFYVRAGIPDFFRDHAIAVADILMPNDFELAWLAKCRVDGVEAALTAARTLIPRGPRLVVVTGLDRRRGDDRKIANLAVTAETAWLAETPRVEAPANGAGDCFAALFLGQYLKRRDIATALSRASTAIHAVMAETTATGGSELALIPAQNVLARPKRLFKAERIG